MISVAILSIKPIYAQKILDGSKSIELRKSRMGMREDDVVIVYSSSPEQRITMWFRIKNVEMLPVDEMWCRYRDRLGIGHEEYMSYFNGVVNAVGLHIGLVQPLSPIPLKEIEHQVPGFVPPQGLIRLADEPRKYWPLVHAFSTPLPKDAFPQQLLGLDLPSSLAQA